MVTTAASPKKPQVRWAWMWFAYTGFLFIQPIVVPSRLLWIGTFASLLIFVFLFRSLFYGVHREQPTQFRPLAATFLLGLVVFPWNGGASTFFIYVAAYLPFIVVSSRRVVTLILLECAAIVAEGAIFTTGMPWALFTLVGPTPFLPCSW